MTKEHEQKITLLEHQREIQHLWMSLLLGGFLLLAVIVFLVYHRYRFKTRAHETLTQVHRDLEQSHHQLKTTQVQLIQQEKLASLGQLTAGIAHEIKNPLNFVNNFAYMTISLTEELKEARLNGEDLEVILEDLSFNASRIMEHGKRADRIVNSMMQVAHRSAGHRTTVDLNAFVREYVGLAFHGMKGKNPESPVEIIQSYDEQIGRVVMDSQEMGQVLINLINNAFDAMEEKAAGEGIAYEPVLEVCTLKKGGQVEIQVRDNGAGIPGDVRDKIFEPFFTTKPAGQGTGLGLSLSYDIVTQGHGGMLRVESEPGRGTRFIVSLPIDEKEAPSYQALVPNGASMVEETLSLF